MHPSYVMAPTPDRAKHFHIDVDRSLDGRDSGGRRFQFIELPLQASTVAARCPWTRPARSGGFNRFTPGLRLSS
jgi:hypothetical protein